ncbi:MAG: hypothetical protein UV05_C0014G0002 [candidate division CPR1 bacterium GW2011_GWA2_42_17]|uniref:Uncharacterized protein n=1 Tax=candidate division CPR1 bacterium GW2011_GWA2_42_17 TaxID=1618341 RepID=A0A0G0Z5M2_9BACT|nr:MAG: hypothetical protein UV05_C0014G0002 [candidate division CPR1 bacterium GW2011_GWA2_42_17]
MTIFYEQFLTLQNLENQLDSKDLADQGKDQLMQIVISSLHHEVITLILSELPLHSHQIFLLLIKTEPQNPKLWEWLEERIKGIKEKIAEKITIIEQEFIEELKD